MDLGVPWELRQSLWKRLLEALKGTLSLWQAKFS